MGAICITENSGGKGGIAGGGGASGQPSLSNKGYGACGYGTPVFEFETGVDCTLSCQLTDDTDGVIPADLSKVKTVYMLIRPTMRSDSGLEIKFPCTFTDDGKISIDINGDTTKSKQGVWYAEIVCLDDEDRIVQTFKAYVCIRKGMDPGTLGPDTITPMDVRMAIMDTSAEANELLDDLEFSDAMILHAVQRALNEFEETPPTLMQRFNATTFPWKEHLLKGAISYLLQSVAYRYMRNRMQYQAGGVHVDNNDKGGSYLQLAASARQEWKLFISAMKTSMNMDECCGVILQPWFS